MFAVDYNMENCTWETYSVSGPVRFSELLLSIMQQHNLARHLKEVSSAGHPLSNLNKRIKGVIDTHSTTSHFDESNECKEEHPPPRQNYPACSFQKDRRVI